MFRSSFLLFSSRDSDAVATDLTDGSAMKSPRPKSGTSSGRGTTSKSRSTGDGAARKTDRAVRSSGAAAKRDSRKEPAAEPAPRSSELRVSASSPLGIAPPAGPDGTRWTFLTNHMHVIVLLAGNSEMVLREVAARIGITERAVQRIIADLEEGGCIEREKVGRRNRYRIHLESKLRHPIEAHRTIGDLLDLIATKR